MPYWVTQNGMAIKSFINRIDAIDWIEKQEALWRGQGFGVPVFKIWYGAQEVSRHYA